jgi:hypothetical protein
VFLPIRAEVKPRIIAIDKQGKMETIGAMKGPIERVH